MAFSSSSSSGNQQYVRCGLNFLKIYKTTTANNNCNDPELSQSQAATAEVEEDERPPYVIVVHGPPKVGKSLLISSLIEHYTEENLNFHAKPWGRRRIQFVECPNNVNGMRDAAKYADAVILLIDAYVGFQLETFEFVNMLRVHGMPKVMGVLTSLDMFENVEILTKTKECLMSRFCTQIYEGARLFCLSGLKRGMYPKHEILDLASFISVMEFHPLPRRAAQPYVLVDRFEDVTRPERVLLDNRCSRDIVLYGYLRGCDIKKGTKVHIAGVGDFSLSSVTSILDPCPLLAGPRRKRSQKGKEHDEREGFRPGTYLRLEVQDVPFEMVENYDPYHPILVGAFSPAEKNVGYMQQDTAAIDFTVEEERPPYVVVVHGTHKVGKSLLIRSIVDHYAKENLFYMHGPVTIISGEQRRIQFVECPNNINGMLDAAKYADAVILLIDVYIGFEMETFEFVNILRVHGMPKIMGVLTSLDLCENVEKLSRTKEYLMNHFCSEICEGARLFCLSGLEHGMYPKHEILDLAGFISVMEFHPSSWRAAQPYVLVDRFEDVTQPESVLMDNRCNRDIVLYGYLRGRDIKKGTKVHIAGVGDFPLVGVTSFVDPCPLLDAPKTKRSLQGKDQNESEGFRPGTYLRLEVRDVPFEMVGNIDPCHPILVGGISPAEVNVGYMQATLKRHTWHRKLLKTKDPIIVSIGWRRYQTTPIYAMEDRSKRLRMLNYTPVDTQCLAMFWGPLASPSTRIVAVQSLPENKAAFRILATAVVVDLDHAAKITKKFKRSGTPWKISGKAALIRDLFKSDHEINRFKDAKIWTDSGTQGKVNKAVKKVFVDRPRRKKVGLAREGIAKCTFKRKICMRDTVFMRVSKEVEVPRFFCPLVPTPSLSDRIEKIKERDSLKPETEDKNVKDYTVWRRESLKGRRMVGFFERQPSLQDLTYARNFELYHCNKEEQKEFEKHPVMAISKEEEMLEIHKRREIRKKYQPQPRSQWSKNERVWRCSKDLYGDMTPTYLTFFGPWRQIKLKK
ncbi:hypothetical protein C5167_044273 [Papaver somniferum]|uniref:Bms1-type G domain-containing protein n=1 Tax=Papaver somniferum TaxID=3469 RepID=A0A4Y7LAJ8_PAPSO|nr:hypothetical protein C5167_044273 [Papaver somniferum]